jgi:hypothetical protein
VRILKTHEHDHPRTQTGGQIDRLVNRRQLRIECQSLGILGIHYPNQIELVRWQTRLGQSLAATMQRRIYRIKIAFFRLSKSSGHVSIWI